MTVLCWRGAWAKVLIDDDLGNSALQRLRFWVDTDNDGDFSDETTPLDSTAVDNDWSAGMVGLQRQLSHGSSNYLGRGGAEANGCP